MRVLLLATSLVSKIKDLTKYVTAVINGVFSSSPDMGYGFHFASCIVGDLIYRMGFYNGSAQASGGYFNVKTKTSTAIATMPVAIYGGCAVYDAVTNAIYFAGGLNNSGQYNRNVYRYNRMTNNWTTVFTNTAFDMQFCRGVLVGRRIYYIGQSGTTTAAYYDIDSSQFVTFALPVNLGEIAATVAIGKYIYVFGGRDKGTNVSRNTIYRFDTVAGNLEYIGVLPNQCVYHDNVFLFKGVVVLTAGYSTPSVSNSQSDLVVFNPITNVCTKKNFVQKRPTFGGCGYHEESETFYTLGGIIDTSGTGASFKFKPAAVL